MSPIKIFPAPNKSHQLILNILITTLTHFDFLQIQAFQNEYQIQLFDFNLNIFWQLVLLQLVLLNHLGEFAGFLS